jgi:hypothetical protein
VTTCNASDPSLPPPTVCRVDSPIRCDWRERAMRADQMFHREGFGWFWLGSRDVTRGWQKCPGCGGTLPTMEGVVARAVETGQWPSDVEGE